MKYTLLRNATALLEYGGKRFLIDPMLDPASARPAIPNTPNQRPNPLVDLPAGWEDIVTRADNLLVTHLHQDHFDDTSAGFLDHNLPLYGQPEDTKRLAALGFWDLHPVATSVQCDGVTISRTLAQHGTGEIARLLAPVSGFVLTAASEPILYVAGDTIWYEPVAETITQAAPEVIVINAGGARFLEGDPIVMTAEDISSVHEASPRSTLVIVHLEAINHCLETRDYYRTRLPELGVDMEKIRIPENGATIFA